MVNGMPDATENWHTTMRPWLGNLWAALSPSHPPIGPPNACTTD